MCECSLHVHTRSLSFSDSVFGAAALSPLSLVKGAPSASKALSSQQQLEPFSRAAAAERKGELTLRLLSVPAPPAKREEKE